MEREVRVLNVDDQPEFAELTATFLERESDRIVDAHDWEIDVTTGSEGGTRFEITGVEFVDE